MRRRGFLKAVLGAAIAPAAAKPPLPTRRFYGWAQASPAVQIVAGNLAMDGAFGTTDILRLPTAEDQ